MPIKQAFTVLEVILVLVIVSILSALVLPKFSVSKSHAQLSKVRSDIAAIRMGILLYKNKTILSGNPSYPSSLDSAIEDKDGEKLFGGVFAYPIVSSKKPFSWSKASSKNYTLWLSAISSDNDNLAYVDFSYDDGNGTFNCDVSYDDCLRVTQ